MNQQILLPGKAVDYPDSDGNPLAENMLQYQYSVTSLLGLDELFANDPNVFVAANLLQPKGFRRSCRPWEEDHFTPKVVFEICFPKYSHNQMIRNFLFFERHGV